MTWAHPADWATSSRTAVGREVLQAENEGKEIVEAVRYENGDRVRVYSAAVRALVEGTVKVPPDSQSGRRNRLYDVLLNDGSLMVGFSILMRLFCAD